ncbi:MAG: hypothetical protein ACTHOD_18385 [Motilibacteraceae bacterium]
MTDTTPRCPRCSALLAPEAAWCSLCFLDLRPAPEPEPEPAPPVVIADVVVADVEPADVEPEVPDLPAPVIAGRRFRPGAAAGATLTEPAPQPAAADLPPEVDALLAQLAVEEGGGRVSLGPLDDAFSTPGRRAGVMAVGALGVTVVLFLVMWVLGKLLG